MVSTTRSATCFSDHSRSGVPRVPLKYFWDRMFVAFMLHEAGTSTPSCSKATLPVAVVGYPSIASLPDDLVVGVDGRRGEMPVNAESRPLRNDGHESVPPRSCPIPAYVGRSKRRLLLTSAPNHKMLWSAPAITHQMQGPLQHCSYGGVNVFKGLSGLNSEVLRPAAHTLPPTCNAAQGMHGRGHALRGR